MVLIVSAMNLHSAPLVWTWNEDAENNLWKNPNNWTPSGDASPESFPTVSGDINGTAIFGYFGDAPLTVNQTPDSTTVTMSRIQVTSEAAANLTIAFADASVLGRAISAGTPVVEIAAGKNVSFTAFSRLLISYETTPSVIWQIDAGATLTTTPRLEHAVDGSTREVVKTGAGTWNYNATQIGRSGAGPRRLSLTIEEGTFAFNPGTANDILYYGRSSATPLTAPTLTINTGATLVMDIGASGDKVRFLDSVTSDLLGGGGNLVIQNGALLELNRLDGFEHGTWYTLFESISTAPEYHFTVSNLLAGESALFQTVDIGGFNHYRVRIQAIPEPSTAWLILLSGVSVWVFRRKSRRLSGMN